MEPAQASGPEGRLTGWNVGWLVRPVSLEIPTYWHDWIFLGRGAGVASFLAMPNEVLSSNAKRRRYDEGSSSFSELVSGFWLGLARRMDRRRKKGVVVASGSGISLAELARAEEAETGIKPEVFMLSAQKDEE